MHALEEIIYPVVDVLQGTKNELKKDPDTVLFGLDATLDSTALISFITGVEEQVRLKTGKGMRLITPETLVMEPNPFETLGSLAVFLDKRLQDGA
jgi:acyl carrier protein